MTDMEKAGNAALVEISGLTIDFRVERKWVSAVKGIDLTLRRGEVLALVGESGSGKSTTAMAIPRLLASNARIHGSIKLEGQELVPQAVVPESDDAAPGTDADRVPGYWKGLAERRADRRLQRATDKLLNPIRGSKVAVIFQEPMTALNPVYTVGWQIVEAIQAHSSISKSDAKKRAVELLKLVDMPEPDVRVKYYPHQLSGGQRQRAMIAQALASDPEVLIADEPTTALDVTVQAEILELIRDLRQRIDSAILLITHDMGVVADMADEIAVMKDGEIVEQGRSREIFGNATHPYTRQLLAAVPHLGAIVDEAEPEASMVAEETVAALSISNATIEFDSGRTKFRAVDGVSIDIAPGEVVGLVGESGSGKSTLGRAAIGLIKLNGGSVSVAGTDITTASAAQLRPIRRQVGVVFQDPGSSLNPRWPIGQAIAEPIRLYSEIDRAAREKKVRELLEQVELPANYLNRYPHELSGGQRQRVGIARALALEPKLLIADEPTSALDVSVQAKVLSLFQNLQEEHGFACLFISHDLAVVEILASRIAVLNKGKLAEFGPSDQVLYRPTDAYTQRLLAAVPVPDPDEQQARRTERRRLLEAGTADS